ncbi:DUF2272 domain-containing protein [Enterobacter sp.]|uniref:DUF2272 domain-containing protein n=1 Tax=Enterobacter sp. TaxID=42895 RepID=UPI00296EBB19|nr:DUF2272 domain-containing protein [Enterobacter sp.]
MSYKDEFEQASGWAAVDVSIRLNKKKQPFLDYLKNNNVATVIRYYASDMNDPKTLTPEEARFLSSRGFSLLPVFQDRSRSITHFSAATGENNAHSALKFALTVGQPLQAGSTIIFSVDEDYPVRDIDGPILDYFQAVQQTIGSSFAIGAYGSGAVLAKLLAEKLITVPWLSMSRGFHGTEPFFYNRQWALRQVPPEQEFTADDVRYGRTILRLPPHELGLFTVDDHGMGHVMGSRAESLMQTLAALTPFSQASATTNRMVATDGLRLRDKPDGVIIRDLTIGEQVEDEGESTHPGWRKVTVGEESGVVFGKYLRDPYGTQTERFIQAAIAEWLRFDKGKGNEREAPYYHYVREMWAAIGEPWDGRSRFDNGDEVPWSAAFISWVVRQAGEAYDNFRFAASHSVYVNNAIKARYTGRTDKPFWGYRINEVKPAPGDIIQKNWPEHHYSFSYAENHSDYNSHADIVVEVTPDVVRVLGGNVGDTVAFGIDVQEYELDKDGFIKPNQHIIAILKNRADALNLTSDIVKVSEHTHFK